MTIHDNVTIKIGDTVVFYDKQGNLQEGIVRAMGGGLDLYTVFCPRLNQEFNLYRNEMQKRE